MPYFLVFTDPRKHGPHQSIDTEQAEPAIIHKESLPSEIVVVFVYRLLNRQRAAQVKNYVFFYYERSACWKNVIYSLLNHVLKLEYYNSSLRRVQYFRSVLHFVSFFCLICLCMFWPIWPFSRSHNGEIQLKLHVPYLFDIQ